MGNGLFGGDGRGFGLELPSEGTVGVFGVDDGDGGAFGAIGQEAALGVEVGDAGTGVTNPACQ